MVSLDHHHTERYRPYKINHRVDIGRQPRYGRALQQDYVRATLDYQNMFMV